MHTTQQNCTLHQKQFTDKLMDVLSKQNEWLSDKATSSARLVLPAKPQTQAHMLRNLRHTHKVYARGIWVIRAFELVHTSSSICYHITTQCINLPSCE